MNRFVASIVIISTLFISLFSSCSKGGDDGDDDTGTSKGQYTVGGVTSAITSVVYNENHNDFGFILCPITVNIVDGKLGSEPNEYISLHIKRDDFAKIILLDQASTTPYWAFGYEKNDLSICDGSKNNAWNIVGGTIFVSHIGGVFTIKFSVKYTDSESKTATMVGEYMGTAVKYSL